MSETKLPDVAPSMRKAALEYAASIARDTEKFGRLVPIETYMMAMTLLADERLRAHAGWHEAIEEAAKVAQAFGENAAEELKTCTDYTRQSRVNFHSAAIVIAARIRALLPPGGEKAKEQT